MVSSPPVKKTVKAFPPEKVLVAYRQMILIRRFEERMAQLYQQGKIGGFCHLYIGQEAVAVAAQHATRADDYMITSYRDHGHPLVRGTDPMRVAAELVMKEVGLARGKGGSMHLFDVERNVYGGHGIVGGQIPVATGMAFASKYLQNDRVTLCFLGEAAVNQGTFHESLNMAALWDLPIVFICENNLYGMGTAVHRASAVHDLYLRSSCAYSIEGIRMDGMDFFASYEVLKKVVEKARQKHRPTFVEAMTYRFRGHSMSDPVHSHYRTKEEVEEAKLRDPIQNMVQYIDENEIAGEDELVLMDKEIKDLVNNAVAQAMASNEPPLESRFEDIYA